jgi:hypothetical protein
MHDNYYDYDNYNESSRNSTNQQIYKSNNRNNTHPQSKQNQRERSFFQQDNPRLQSGRQSRPLSPSNIEVNDRWADPYISPSSASDKRQLATNVRTFVAKHPRRCGVVYVHLLTFGIFL